jgi:hypothetical protein
MTATNSVLAAKDGNGNPYNLTVAAESGSGNKAQKTYIGEPVGETIIIPAQEGTDGTGITAPTGAIGIRGWLSGIYNKLSGALAVTGTFWQTTQPISVASLPLPTGAATAAGLATINTTLGTPMQATGGAVTANAGTNLNTSALAIETGGNLASIKTNTALTAAGATAANGQGIQGMTGGVPVPVSGTFWQTTQPMSVASLPLPAGAASESGGNLATIATAQGVSGTGIAQPTGGSGVLGWLSGIYSTLLSILTGVTNPIPAGTALIGKVGIDQTTPGTTNAVAITTPGRTPASESSTAGNTSIAASIPAVASQYSYLSTVFLSGLGATAAATVSCNITNVLSSNSTSNTWTFQISVPAGVTVPLNGGVPIVMSFVPPLQAKAINTAIQVNIGAFGAGNTQACVGVSGYNSTSLNF